MRGSSRGLSGLDDRDRTGWRAERLKFANIAKACLSHQHREQSIGVGLGVLDAVELLDRQAEQQPHEAAALFPIVGNIELTVWTVTERTYNGTTSQVTDREGRE